MGTVCPSCRDFFLFGSVSGSGWRGSHCPDVPGGGDSSASLRVSMYLWSRCQFGGQHLLSWAWADSRVKRFHFNVLSPRLRQGPSQSEQINRPLGSHGLREGPAKCRGGTSGTFQWGQPMIPSSLNYTTYFLVPICAGCYERYKNIRHRIHSPSTTK